MKEVVALVKDKQNERPHIILYKPEKSCAKVIVNKRNKRKTKKQSIQIVINGVQF